MIIAYQDGKVTDVALPFFLYITLSITKDSLKTMITFINNNEKPNSKSKITIDLTTCVKRNDYILAIGEKLHASYSTPLVTGNSLDALHDVVSDWFIENHLKWKDVFIQGWQTFTQKESIYAQKVLTVLMEGYITYLGGQAQMIKWQEFSFDDSKMFEAIRVKQPSIFLILN